MNTLPHRVNRNKTPRHVPPTWTRGVICEVGPDGLIAPIARAGESTCLLVPLSEIAKNRKRYFPITLHGQRSSMRRYFFLADLQRHGVPLSDGRTMYIGIPGNLLRRFAPPVDWEAARRRLAEASL